MTDLKDEHVKQKLPKDARLAAKCLQETGSFETGQAILRECADRIEELEVKLAWQPMESAPKDKLILGHADGMVRLVMWENGQWYQVGATIEMGWFDPTEWMPLPTTPSHP